MFCSDRASVPLMGLLLPNLGRKAIKKFLEGTMNVLCKYTLRYGSGPVVHCVWAVLRFVDAKNHPPLKWLHIGLVFAENCD